MLTIRLTLKGCCVTCLTFKLKAAECPQGQGDTAHVAGLGNVGEAGRGQLVCQALGHARVAQGLVHQHQREHLQQPVLDVLLELRDLTAQVIQHCSQSWAVWVNIIIIITLPSDLGVAPPDRICH